MMKKNYALIVLLFTMSLSFGQTITQVWATPYSLPERVGRTGPAIASDGTVYIGCNFPDASRLTLTQGNTPNNFFAINPDGSLKWGASITEGATFNKVDAIESSPSISPDGSVYMGGHFGRRLYKINPATGAFITRDLASRIRYSAAAFATDGTVIQLTRNNGSKGVRSLSSDLSTENWIAASAIDFNSTPAIAADGTIYAAGSNATGINNIYAINPNGTIKWSKPYCPVIGFASSAIALANDGTIYLSAKLNANVPADGVLKAYDPLDGTEKWSVTLTGTNAEQGGPAVAADGTVYLGNNGGFMRAYNPNTGAQLWSFTASGGIEVVPAIDNLGRIYFGTTTGNFYVLNSDGTEAYTMLDLGDRIDSSAAIDKDGSIYVAATLGTGANSGKLYKLQTTATGLQTGGWPMYAKTPMHNSNARNIWIGATSTDWSVKSNWDLAVPSTSNDVGIPVGTLNNQPTIASDVNIKSLVIGTGATLSVNAGNTLNVSNAITNSGDLILNSTVAGTANLLSGSSAPNVTQQRYLASNQRGWRLLGNPLSTTTFGSLAANSTTPLTLGANASGAYDSATNTWTSGTDADNMVSQQGYKVFLRGRTSEVTGSSYTVSPPSNVTLAIKGTAANTVPAAINTTAGQFYLVSNPYTASVSLFSILGASSGLSSTVSYYNPTIGSSGSNADLILKYGGYANPTITAANQGDANDVVLPPMGAIFVQAISNGTINIPKTTIFIGPVLGGNYNHKTAQAKVASTNALKLEVSSDGTYYDTVALQFKALGEAGSAVDFGKLPNTILDIYSIVNSNNMAVSEVELKDQVIPLGITSTVQKSYTLKVAENTIPAGFDAELIDNVSDTKTILSPGTTYNFTIDNTSASQGNARFAINLKTAGTLSVTPNELDSKIKLWPNPAHNQFNILNSDPSVSSIEISNLNGQVIHRQKSNPGTTTTIQTNGWVAGVYFLKATNGEFQTIKKLIIQ